MTSSRSTEEIFDQPPTIPPSITHSTFFSATPMNENPSNPLYLHHAENPRAILVSQPLMGAQNYSTWSRSMLMALTIKNKLGFLDGSILKPSQDNSS